MINKEKITVGVHDGQFHADDVLCVVMLMEKYGKENVNVIRTRDESILETCDYVLDVGEKDLITDTKVCFDHHQNDSGTYENGIEMAACGKLAQYLYGDDINVLDGLRKSFLYAVEAPDNGQKVEDFDLKPSIFDFIHMINPAWNEDKSMYDVYFKTAVESALPVFKQTLKKIKLKELSIQLFENDFKKYDKEDRILYLNCNIPWQNFVIEKNKEGAQIAAVCFKGTDGDYNIWSVPSEKGEFSPARLPQSWAGLRNEELQKVSGIKSAVFCFKPRCFFVCSDKKDALKVALKMVEEERRIEQNREEQTI